MRSKLLARLTCAALFAGCVFGLSTAAASAATLNGAGSTLVAPIEAEWAAAWGQSTGNTVNYGSVGSGTGYTDIARGLVDFGASDAPLSVYSTPPCANCVQIPWALSATGVSYRVDGVRFARGQHSLHLTGPVLASIYLGQITNWADPRIKNLNKGTSIPSTPITVLWRSDSSGDTYAFTRYLADVSSAFAGRVGSSTTVSFPTGVGARGNAGLASAEAGTNGAIAYIAVSYLIANRLPAIGIKNASGHYVVPNLSRDRDRRGRGQAPVRQPGDDRQSAQARQERISDLDVHLRHRADDRAAGRPAAVVLHLRDRRRTAVRTVARLRAAAEEGAGGGPGHDQKDRLIKMR